MKNNKMAHTSKAIFNFSGISACILLFHLTETNLWKVVLSTKCVQLLVYVPHPHSVTLVNNCRSSAGLAQKSTTSEKMKILQLA